MDFVKFPKLYRLNGPVIVTEKIDGTNACVVIENGEIYAQSRTRIITPQSDNFGFAKWVYEHKAQLIEKLGEGRHYGEWFGNGIQRGYGLKQKHFALFNTSVWRDDTGLLIDSLYKATQDGLNITVVPILHIGIFDTLKFAEVLARLKETGSQIAEGFMNPEGIVIYDTNSGVGYKKTFDYDDTGKGGIRDIDGNIIAPK